MSGTIKKSKPNYYFTIISVALVLFLFGLFGIIALNANALIRYFKENIEVSVEISNEANEIEVVAFRDNLSQKNYVKRGSIDYITKEAGAEFMKEAFGDDFIKYGLENPLLDIIRFNIKASHLTPQNLAKIKKEFEALPFVDYVFYEEVQVSSIAQNIYRLGGITFFIGLCFALITFVLINNTVRLALYSNRFMIKNMQLVGATPTFISKPYLLRGVKNGLFSGLIACAGLGLLAWSIYRTFPELVLFQDWVNFSLLGLVILLLGVGISALSTRWSINKYLNMSIEELY